MIDWYNSEEKEQFMNEIFGEDKSDIMYDKYKDLFSEIAALERAYGKDISEFTHNQLCGTFEHIVSSNDVFLQKRQMLAAYTAWVKKISRRRMIRTISFEMLDLSKIMKSSYIFSPEELGDKTLKAFGDNYSSGIFYKACVHLVFTGCKVDEIVNLKKSDIDFNTASIRKSNLMFQLDKWTQAILETCINTSELDIVDTLGRHRTCELCSNDYLIRHRYYDGCDQEKPCNVSQVYKAFEEMNDRLGTNYSYTTIHKSGFFYWLYQHEKITKRKIRENGKYYQEISEKYWDISPNMFPRISHDYKQWLKYYTYTE